MHILLGISAFNSKFNTDYISAILEWAFNTYESVDVVHPGEKAYFLLAASGTPEIRAKRKARKEFSRHNRAIESYCEHSGHKLAAERVLTFDDFIGTTPYKFLHSKVLNELKNNNLFRAVCEAQTQSAIDSRSAVTQHNIDTFDLHLGVEYIITELPIVMDPARLLPLVGSKNSTNVMSATTDLGQSWTPFVQT